MRIFVVSMMILFLSVNFSYAQTISLSQAISLGLKRNNILNSKKLSLKSFHFAYKASLGSLYPSLSFQYSNSNTNTKYRSLPQTPISIQHSNTFSAQGSMPLYTGGYLAKTIVNAKLSKDASYYGLINYKYRLVYNIENIYMNLIEAEQNLKTQKMKLKNAENSVRITEAKYKSGLGTKSDILTSKAYFAQNRAMLEKLKMNFKQYQIQLSYYLDADRLYNPDTSILSKIVRLPKNINTNIRKLTPIKQQEVQYKIAQNNVSIALSKFLPQVSLNYSYSRNYSNMDMNDINSANIGVNVNLPIFTGFSRINQYQENKLQAMSIRKKMDDTERLVLSDIKTTFYNIKYLQSQLSYTKASVESSRINYKTTLEKFKYNLSTIYDVDDALSDYYNALFDEIQAKSNLMLAVMKFEMLSEHIGKYLPFLSNINKEIR